MSCYFSLEFYLFLSGRSLNYTCFYQSFQWANVPRQGTAKGLNGPRSVPHISKKPIAPCHETLLKTVLIFSFRCGQPNSLIQIELLWKPKLGNWVLAQFTISGIQTPRIKGNVILDCFDDNGLRITWKR